MPLPLPAKSRLLASLPLFAALEPDALHVLAFSVRERSLAAGEQLFAQGAVSEGGFVVIDGEIRLLAATGPVALGPGSLIGAAALIAETRRPATAVATTPTQVLDLPRALMQQVLESHPGSARSLRKHVETMIAGTRDALKQVVMG